MSKMLWGWRSGVKRLENPVRKLIVENVFNNMLKALILSRFFPKLLGRTQTSRLLLNGKEKSYFCYTETSWNISLLDSSFSLLVGVWRKIRYNYFPSSVWYESNWSELIQQEVIKIFENTYQGKFFVKLKAMSSSQRFYF